MSIIESDLTRFFVFEYPIKFAKDTHFFNSFYENPYHIWDEQEFDANYNSDNSYNDFNKFKYQFYINTLSTYCLPFKFDSKPLFNEDPFDDEIIGYTHILEEMAECDVNTAFSERAFEYFNNDIYNNNSFYSYEEFEGFLFFHYSRCHYDLRNWLDYVEQIFETIDKYIKIPQLAFLNIKKLGINWITNRRKILAELIGETIEQPPTVEAVEETVELGNELEMTGHKVVLLHELGIIEYLQKLRREKNPTMSDTKFAELIGLILGLKGNKIEAVRKGISGYSQGTKDDPKTKKALKNVKSELLKLGIEL